jgi:uncharacterized protein YndB with AHSA1/START domain
VNLLSVMMDPLPCHRNSLLGREKMTLKNAPIAKTQMLIRKPVEDVYEAFVNPAITTKFWFTKSSGRLETGKDIRWDWEMYGVFTQVRVKTLEANRRILIEWDNPPCPVEWLFAARPDRTTFVTISNWGFRGNDDEKVAQAIDSMGGFSQVLAGLKALLEHNVQLNLVADHNPDAHKRAET